MQSFQTHQEKYDAFVELVAANSKVCVVGEGGSGKTSIIREAYENAPRIFSENVMFYYEKPDVAIESENENDQIIVELLPTYYESEYNKFNDAGFVFIHFEADPNYD